MIVLVTGPVRSGKSTRAAGLARDFGHPVVHVVTARADPSDPEMNDRIARHRAERGSDPTVELWAPNQPDLPAVVASPQARTTLLVDSLGTWLAGHLLDLEAAAQVDPVGTLARLERHADTLVAALAAPQIQSPMPIVLVSEEVGWGLVPVSAQGRIFRDALGRLNARVGRLADVVEMVVAGFALDLRQYGVPVRPESGRPPTAG